MTRVIVFGTFDPLHPGHLHLFRESRRHGDHLTCIVSRDSTIERIKARTPFQDEAARLTAVAATGLVDHARLGHHEDVYRVLSEEHPDVICLGYDQTYFVSSLEDELRTRNITARIIRISAYDPHIHKSTLLRVSAGETHK